MPLDYYMKIFNIGDVVRHKDLNIIGLIFYIGGNKEIYIITDVKRKCYGYDLIEYWEMLNESTKLS